MRTGGWEPVWQPKREVEREARIQDYEYVKIQGQTPEGESLVTATLRMLQSQRGGSNDQLSDRIQLPDRIIVRIDDQTGVVKELKLYWDHRQLGLLALEAEYLGEVDQDMSRN